MKTRGHGKAKITVRKLNPKDSLLFEVAIPNGKNLELLITNNKNETLDVFNSEISAIYIKEDNTQKQKKLSKY